MGRAGVAHGDLILQNILFRPPCGVAIIDFEKSRSGHRGTFVEGRATHARVAFCVLRALPTEIAKRTFANAIGNMADNANAYSDAKRRECRER
jgi:tRNA A-37 threonylcarbamoyl transferase component Bud32